MKNLTYAVGLHVAFVVPSNALIIALNPAGQINTPSTLDLTAFDATGRDLIPEPSSALPGVVGGLLALNRRHR
jgi:hypothetical protein